MQIQIALRGILCFVVCAVMQPTTAKYKTPSWFSHPNRDEYVGVSLPFNNAIVGEQTAIMSALMSYVISRRTTATHNDSIPLNREYVMMEEESSSFSYQNFKYEIPLSYNIKEKEISKNGHVWVALVVDTIAAKDTLHVQLEQRFVSFSDDSNSHRIFLNFSIKGTHHISARFIFQKNVLDQLFSEMFITDGNMECQFRTAYPFTNEDNKLDIVTKFRKGQTSSYNWYESQMQDEDIEKKESKKNRRLSIYPEWLMEDAIHGEGNFPPNIGLRYLCALCDVLKKKERKDMISRKEYVNIANYFSGNEAIIFYQPQ